MFKEYDGVQVRVELDKFNSEHFGLQMGNMNVSLVDSGMEPAKVLGGISSAIEDARQEGFQHLTCRVRTADKLVANAVVRNEFRIADTLVTYCFWLGKSTLTPMTHRCTLGDCREEDIPRLKEIARTSFQIDRFHSDPALSNELCDLYYERWFENSCRGFADKVSVAYHNGKPVGFTTGKYPEGDEFIYVVLSAVDADIRGQGLYTSMVYDVVQWAQGVAKNCPHVKGIRLGTQIDNVIVQKAWIRLGFTMYDSQYVFQRTI